MTARLLLVVTLTLCSGPASAQFLPKWRGSYRAAYSSTGVVRSSGRYSYYDSDAKSTCEEVRSDICKTIFNSNYTLTSFPNFFHHQTQTEALHELDKYSPLVRVGCYKYLAHFLCSLYVPLCSPTIPIHVPPCRSLCTQARDNCTQILQKFGFSWQFNCTKLTPENPTEICIKPPGAGASNKRRIVSPQPHATKRSAASSSNKRGRFNVRKREGDVVALSCRSGGTIVIHKVKHPSASKCCSTASKAVIAALCDGRQTCTFPVTTATLGAHCAGGVVSVHVRHKCSSKRPAKHC